MIKPPMASAVPSFARQTGQPCATCHTAFPELTPFGRRFKLNGYTLSLWSERFDREMQDVFAIQDDITRAIMAALKLRLAGRSDHPVFKLQTTNAEAYELYLKGRFYWNQRGIGLRKALHYFELALIEDPDYALAMSGLSDTYSLLSWYGDLPPAEAIPKAIAPAKRAVQLDPQLAEAHTSLGFCQKRRAQLVEPN